MLKTFHYSRAEMGRAILEAGQFAHIPEAAVWSLLDNQLLPGREMVRVYLGPTSGYTQEAGYRAHIVMAEVDETFDSLCPVCLRLLGSSRRWRVWSAGYSSCWQRFDGRDGGGLARQSLSDWWKDEQEQDRYWTGNAHTVCANLGRVLDDISAIDAGNATDVQYGNVVRFLTGRRFNLKRYLEIISDFDAPVLRFNPRTARRPDDYKDMRRKIDPHWSGFQTQEDWDTLKRAEALIFANAGIDS